MKFLYLSVVLGFLASCGDSNTVAGGEDFPNTFADMGGLLSQSLQGQAAPAISGPGLGAAAPPPKLGRLLGSDTSLVIDSAAGLAYVINRGLQSTDTAAVLLDASFSDAIQGNEKMVWWHSWSTGVVNTAILVSDADGDGLIYPVKSAADRARAVTRKWQGDVESYQEILEGPGVDANYGTGADNPIYALVETQKLGGVLRSEKSIRPVESSGFWMETLDSVQLWVMETRRSLGDTTVKTSQTLWNWHSDVNKSKFVDYRAKSVLSTGAMDSVWLSRTGGSGVNLRQWSWNVLGAKTSAISLDLRDSLGKMLCQRAERMWWNRVAGEDSLRLQLDLDPAGVLEGPWESGRLGFDSYGSRGNYSYHGSFTRTQIQGQLTELSSGKQWNKSWER